MCHARLSEFSKRKTLGLEFSCAAAQPQRVAPTQGRLMTQPLAEVGRKAIQLDAGVNTRHAEKLVILLKGWLSDPMIPNPANGGWNVGQVSRPT